VNAPTARFLRARVAIAACFSQKNLYSTKQSHERVGQEDPGMRPATWANLLRIARTRLDRLAIVGAIRHSRPMISSTTSSTDLFVESTNRPVRIGNDER